MRMKEKNKNVMFLSSLGMKSDEKFVNMYIIIYSKNSYIKKI